LKLVSSDFQRIDAAEVAPKTDLIVETKIACSIAEVFRSPKPLKHETPIARTIGTWVSVRARALQFVGPNARNHGCKVTGQSGLHCAK
jgi:hypothetical protein